MNDATKKPEPRKSKFKPCIHVHLDNAVNSFMVSNNEGAICGGNLRMFYNWNDIMEEGSLRYPAVFKSRESAYRYMIEDRAYLNRVES